MICGIKQKKKEKQNRRNYKVQHHCVAKEINKNSYLSPPKLKFVIKTKQTNKNNKCV